MVGQPAGPAVRLRLARLLGDRDRRVRADPGGRPATAPAATRSRAVVDAAGRGDAMAQAALRQVGDWLGFGVANLVNIFNPEMVIFGGTLRDVYLASAAQVRGRLTRMALPASREHVRLRTPALGDDATLLGAAELAFERLLADPLEAAGTIEPEPVASI